MLKLCSESGVYSCIRRDDRRVFTIESAFAATSCIVLCYAYIFEVKALRKGMISTLTRVCGLSEPEMRFFDSVRAV